MKRVKGKEKIKTFVHVRKTDRTRFFTFSVSTNKNVILVNSVQVCFKIKRNKTTIGKSRKSYAPMSSCEQPNGWVLYYLITNDEINSILST